MSDKLLLQEEIDALLGKRDDGQAGRDNSINVLPEKEKSTLIEIFRIAMARATTDIAPVLNEEVRVTGPALTFTIAENIGEKIQVPHAVMKVNFSGDFTGEIFFVVKIPDAAAVANILTGEVVTPGAGELTEKEAGAAGEVFGRMAGSIARTMGELLNGKTDFSVGPLVVRNDGNQVIPSNIPLVLLSYNMLAGDLLNAEFFQVMLSECAGELAAQLLNDSQPADLDGEYSEPLDQPAVEPFAAPSGQPRGLDYQGIDQQKLDLILDIPLKVSVVLGRARRPIKEVLGLAPGSLVELTSLVDEPVEVLVNGTLVARGEIVVVDENFGVRITSIISPAERFKRLGK